MKAIERRVAALISKVRVGVHGDAFEFSDKPVVNRQPRYGQDDEYQTDCRQPESDKVLKVLFEGSHCLSLLS